MLGRTALGSLLAGGAMAVLGGSFAASSLIADYPPLGGQAVRYAAATAALALLARAGRRALPRPTRPELARLLALALTGLVGFNLAVLAALRNGEPAALGVIVGCSPLGIAILGPLLAGRRPERRALLAAVVVSLGAAVAQGGGATTPWGLLFSLLALAGEVAFSLLAVPLLPRLTPLGVSTYVCGLAAAVLALGAVLVEGAGALPLPTPAQALATAYLALALTVAAFVAWYSAIGLLGVERTGLFAGVVPISALLSAALVGTGTLAPTGLLGALLVGAGVAFGLRGGSTEARAAPRRRGAKGPPPARAGRPERRRAGAPST
jgi:drug/metabolite transporter (DMT)-like permease